MEDASTSKNTKGKLNASGAFSKGYLVFAITILLLISLLKMSDRELLAPLYEPVSHELGLNDLQFGMIRSSTDVALIIGAILFGLLADRWRRRDIVALGVLCCQQSPGAPAGYRILPNCCWRVPA